MKHRLSLVLAFFLAFCAIGSWAQSTATLSGTVTDPTGAVVANAQVKIHSLATGLDRDVVTDAAGIYSAPSLVPGDYRVEATAAGFSTSKVQISLDVDQHFT
jgi:hypothetical protein